MFWDLMYYIDMIKDSLVNAKKYYKLSSQIEAGLMFLQTADLQNLSPAQYKIDGENLYVNVEEYETKTSDKVEAHRRYIDIQYIIKGEEHIGVAPIEHLSPICEYDVNRDIIFYNGEVDKQTMRQGDFLILYPEDGHLPCQTIDKPQRVKKAVVKVKILQ